MLRRWVRACPRCHGHHVLELKDDYCHAARCMECGYLFSSEEIRYLLDDVAAKADQRAA
jgi:hypothetical protein